MRIVPRTARPAVALYALVLTYVLLAPHPLWVFGAAGSVAEKTVDSRLPGAVQHVLAYVLLTWLLIFAAGSRSRLQSSWCAALAVAHGLLTELAQLFIPFRCCDLPDVMANLLGVGVGWLTAPVAIGLLRTNPTSD